LDEEKLRLKPPERDPDILIDAEWMLPQHPHRLRYFGEGE
jgi:hypothetical protein